MFNADVITKIDELARKANSQRVITVPGDPADVYHLQNAAGDYERRVAVKPRQHKALDETAILDFAARFAHPSFTAIWYSREAVIAILDDYEEELLDRNRESVTLTLRLSAQVKKLQELETKNEWLKQADVISLLRTAFHGCLQPAGEIIALLRQLKFTKNQSSNSDLQHGRRNVSSAIVAEVTGRDQIPEVFKVDVPIFENAFPNFRDTVELIVDIDDLNERIKLLPAPGSIEAAIASAEQRIGTLLNEQIGEVMGRHYHLGGEGKFFVDDSETESIGVPPIYYGKP